MNNPTPDRVRLAPPLVIGHDDVDAFLAAWPGILDDAYGGPLMTRSFLADDDLSQAEQAAVLDAGRRPEAGAVRRQAARRPAQVATIYDKPTLRTQVSFAAGIAELGGHPMLVDGTLAGIGKRESVADVARVLGRQAAAIVWRTYGQDAIEEMAAYSGVPGRQRAHRRVPPLPAARRPADGEGAQGRRSPG